MTKVDRRSFLQRASTVALAPSLAGLAGLAACSVDTPLPSEPSLSRPKKIPRAGKGFGGYGPLTESTDCPELLIPEGFKCVKLSTTFAPSLADPSFIVPTALDGMAAFNLTANRVRLVRNHEIRDNAGVAPPIGDNAYDPLAGAGTTTVEVRLIRERGFADDDDADDDWDDLEGDHHDIEDNGRRRRRGGGRVVDVVPIKEFASIAGTFTNCAGGPTPWGSWLTCEETTAGPGGGFGRDHGYIFEVAARANGCVNPVPLKSMGRFVHEAVAVDPRTGFIYETEDRSFDLSRDFVGSGMFRFIPNRRRDLTAGGRLQALAVVGQPNYNTTTGQIPGQILPVAWVDIDDPDPSNAEDDTSAVFRQGLARGAAIFQRLEGCWFGDGSVFFNATSGGDAGEGQVWQYHPRGGRGAQLSRNVAGTLSLVFESPGADVLESPDNITVSPRGGLVLCEDGGGVQFIRGLTQWSEIFDLVQTNGDSPEFAGATFSADGDVLFFNIQGSTRVAGSSLGYTFAMFGPWEDGALG